MQVTEIQARRLFRGLGFNTVSDWDTARLQKQLDKPLTALKDEADDCSDKDAKVLYKKFSEAQKSGDALVLEGASPDKKPPKKDKTPPAPVSKDRKSVV